MTEEPVAQQEPKPHEAGKPFDFDKEFEEQKKKDVETFKSYGLVTKEDMDSHVKQFVEALQADNTKLREEFQAFKEWALRKKAQGMNSGSTEKPVDSLAQWKPQW